MGKVLIKYIFFSLFLLLLPLSVSAQNCDCRATSKGLTKIAGNQSWEPCEAGKTSKMKQNQNKTIKDFFSDLKKTRPLLKGGCYPFREKDLGLVDGINKNNFNKLQNNQNQPVSCGENFEGLVEYEFNPSQDPDPLNWGKSFSGFYSVTVDCGALSGEGGQQEEESGKSSFSVPNASSLNKLETDSIPQLIGRIIEVILQIVGTVALIMFIYGGLLIMTSEGKSDRYYRGMKTMLWSALGTVTIFASYALVGFVFKAF